MKKQRKNDQAERIGLSPHDRKILEKYTGIYTNFIESNTAETDIHDNQDMKNKK